MKKNKLLVVVGVAVLIGMIGYNIIHKQLLGQDNTVKIGVLSFMTGTYAQMGNDLANGILLAKEEYEGGADHLMKVELKIEDGKGEGKTSASAFARLQQWGMDASIIAGDNQVPTVAPVVIRDKIPTVATIISNSKCIDLNANDVWIFRDWISVTSMADATADFAVEKLGVSKFAILKMRSEFGDEAEHAFNKRISESGGSVVHVDSFNETDTDARNIITKTLSNKPNAIYVAGHGVCYGVVINQLRECGFDGFILTVDAVISPETKSQIKDKRNIYFSSFIEPNTLIYNSFKERYKKRFGREASIYAAYGYDSLNILILGFNGQKLSAYDLRNNILNHETYHVVLGTLKFKANGDCTIPVAVRSMDSIK